MGKTAGMSIFSYLLAAAVVLAALALKLSMSRIWDDESPFLLFFVSVFVAAWQGGFWCGLFATAFSITLASFFFIVPFHSFESSFENVLSLGIFAAEATLIVWMTDALRDAKEKLTRALEAERGYSAELTRSVSQIHQLNERLRLAMTETHHRVKNSLQTIGALLQMQVRGSKGASAAEIKEIISQVHGIGILHDVLTDRSKHDRPLEQVSAREVLGKVIPLLRQSVGDRDIDFHIDDGTLDARQASSLVVIVNELVSNSIKHGGKRIRVLLVRNGEHLVLQVKDDGKGFPPDFDIDRHGNTGMRLIRKLSESDFRSSPAFAGSRDGGCVTLTIAASSTTGAGAAAH